MKTVLVNQLKGETLDKVALAKLIKSGVPVKKFGFFGTEEYKEIGLFESNNNYNIFHILAQKGGLTEILPIIMNNAVSILVVTVR